VLKTHTEMLTKPTD